MWRADKLVCIKCLNIKSISRFLPSCFSVLHKFLNSVRSSDLPASCHTQTAAWSSHAGAGTGTDGTAGWAPSPAAANTRGFQHPSGPGAGEEDNKDTNKLVKLFLHNHFTHKKKKSLFDHLVKLWLLETKCSFQEQKTT